MPVDSDEHAGHEHAPDDQATDEQTTDSESGDIRPRFDAEGEDASFEGYAEVDPFHERNAPRTSSHFVLDAEDIAATPRTDILLLAPSFFVSRPEGDGVAPHITVRGFDAEHGQDVEFLVGGIPINQPSHIHSQGYADLNFLIPELVTEMRVREGVYDPRQGDFATAGSVEFDLGSARRGLFSQSSYGSFQTLRELLWWAPVGERRATFVATNFRSTDGFGPQRRSQSGGILGQYEALLDRQTTLRVLGSAYANRSLLPGVLRRDDLSAGRVGFFDSYADPSAQAQSAFSLRTLLGGELRVRGAAGSFVSFSGWTSYANFRSQVNFTGYTERPSRVETGVPQTGRGDLIEQQNGDFAIGLGGRFRTSRFRPMAELHGFIEAGATGVLHVIDQRQNLLQAPQNETWDRRVDASVQAMDIGAYVDADLHFWNLFRLRGGLRADVLGFGVDDRLGNAIPSFRRDSYIVGYRRTAFGIAAGPRVSLEFHPTSWLVATAAYGEGYRSPQARILSDGETAPFARVQSSDLGVRLGDRRAIELAVSGFYTHLSSDIAFDPRDNQAEALGPTTRLGLTAFLRWRPMDWFRVTGSATFVRATLDSPPPPTREDPISAYTAGSPLPYVPPFVARAEFSGSPDLMQINESPLELTYGVGISAVSERPLPFGYRTPAFGTLDLSLGVSYQTFALRLDLQNATDLRYAAMEYAFASNWDPSEVPSRVPERHFAAGAPMSLMLNLVIGGA